MFSQKKFKNPIDGSKVINPRRLLKTLFHFSSSSKVIIKSWKAASLQVIPIPWGRNYLQDCTVKSSIMTHIPGIVMCLSCESKQVGNPTSTTSKLKTRDSKD
jgi:hypothetical protein